MHIPQIRKTSLQQKITQITHSRNRDETNDSFAAIEPSMYTDYKSQIEKSPTNKRFSEI
jgi:hypothetical protein